MPTDAMALPDAPGSLVIITGPPGAGKSTVAELLAVQADRPTVHLHTDSFYRWIRSGFVLPYLPPARRQNEVVIDAIVEAAFRYAAGGYDVVIDGILGPWFLDPFRVAAARDDRDLSYVVLRPPLNVVLTRAAGRTGEALRDVEPIRGLHGAFADLGELEHCVIDSSDQTAHETATTIRTALDRHHHRLHGASTAVTTAVDGSAG